MVATRGAASVDKVFPGWRYDADLAVWLMTGAAVLLLLSLRGRLEWLTELPADMIVPLGDWLNAALAWFVGQFRSFFRFVAWLLGWPLAWLKDFLHWLPWPATIAVFVTIAHFAGGRRLALFALGALLYMVVVGLWDETMNTLALVGVAVPMSITGGLFFGILAFKYRAAKRITQPTLDLMQTVPTFAYLIPFLILFGLGPVVGMIAAAIYAMPPMVRNVMLGLSRVPTEVVESARMSGSTERQLLWWVRMPFSLPTIMVGVNQTIMAGLSMVVLAAIIGAYADIGWEVVRTLRKAQFGQSLLAGIVISLVAMITDRIGRGIAGKPPRLAIKEGTVWQRHPHLSVALVVAVTAIVLAELVPALRDYPRAWTFFPAQPLNQAVTWFTGEYFHITKAIKNFATFFVLLPFRIGLEDSVRPHVWGFSLTLPMSLGYATAVATLALLVARLWSWRTALAVIIIGELYYFGTTGTPWPAFILVLTVIAWQVGGRRLGLFALGGLSFMLLTGAWYRAMLSAYLCGVAIAIAFVMGSALGVWAARNDRVSAFLRPINDTLQTIPLFVFLIPIIMVFLIGEFSALLAIVAYSFVPAIRYTEHGLRHVPAEVVEAARSMGCTRHQLLWHVQIPLALPEIMLGLNQVIMMALAMLVVAALVGTLGLGQMVFQGLHEVNFGKGAIAGLSIAFIAMIADRVIQGWSARKKAELGLA